MDKVDVRRIVVDHVRTLHAPGSPSLDWEDIVVFFGLPVFAGLLYLAFANPPSDGNKIDEVLVASFSIFAALLLNIQVFLLGFHLPSLVQGGEGTEQSAEERALAAAKAETRVLFYREMFSNISYSILLAMGIVVITLLAIFCQIEHSRLIKFFQFILILHFALTLLMVMKRVHVLFYAVRVG